MKIPKFLLPLAISALASAATAFDGFSIPWEHAVTFSKASSSDSYEVPTGPFRDGGIKSVRIEGGVDIMVVNIPGELSTLQLLSGMRESLTGLGFRELYSCDSRNCGGYDFRANAGIVAVPEMFVDLGDFRFLSAYRGIGGADEYATVFASRSAKSGYAQIVFASSGSEIQSGDGSAQFRVETGNSQRSDDTALVELLASRGYATFQKLVFESGSPNLGDNEFAELADLAVFLKANPKVSAILVGHTDAEGTLEINLEISKKRAQSVLDRLVSVHGVDSARLSAEGIGFLAPRASNFQPDGRERNRRVEIVLVRPK